jgi:uncharacterized paraquat-inducible protein A
MVRKIDTIKRLRLVGDFLMLGAFLMLLWLFITAYLSNNFSTTVHINDYGEAHVEMIILVFFLLPLFLFTTALSFLDWRQTWKAKKMVSSQKYLFVSAPVPHQDIPEDKLICPRCYDRFEARSNYFNGRITCPTCGLRGTYEPNDFVPREMNNKPTVRIIKDIRR